MATVLYGLSLLLASLIIATVGLALPAVVGRRAAPRPTSDGAPAGGLSRSSRSPRSIAAVAASGSGSRGARVHASWAVVGADVLRRVRRPVDLRRVAPSTPCPSQASALVGLDFETGAELSVAVPAPQR